MIKLLKIEKRGIIETIILMSAWKSDQVVIMSFRI